MRMFSPVFGGGRGAGAGACGRRISHEDKIPHCQKKIRAPHYLYFSSGLTERRFLHVAPSPATRPRRTSASRHAARSAGILPTLLPKPA